MHLDSCGICLQSPMQPLRIYQDFLRKVVLGLRVPGKGLRFCYHGGGMLVKTDPRFNSWVGRAFLVESTCSPHCLCGFFFWILRFPPPSINVYIAFNMQSVPLTTCTDEDQDPVSKHCIAAPFRSKFLLYLATYKRPIKCLLQNFTTTIESWTQK